MSDESTKSGPQIVDLTNLEPMHPTPTDRLEARIKAMEERLDKVLAGQVVEYQDQPDNIQVVGNSGYITRRGKLLGSSVVVTQAGPDVVFIIKGEEGRLSAITARACKLVD